MNWHKFKKLDINNLKENIIAIVGIFILMGTIAGFWGMFFYTNYSKNIEDYKSQKISNISNKLETALYGYRVAADTYFQEIINTEEIKEIVKSASTLDVNERANLREKLAEKLKNTFYNSQNNNFGQIHFQLKDGTSFLRLNRPDIYGDDVMTVRETVKIANTEKRSVSGFEEGLTFYGYRFVYPLSYQNEFVGTVETSISIKAIIELFDQLFSDFSRFIIYQDNNSDTYCYDCFKENFIISDISEEYLYDKQLLMSENNLNTVFDSSRIKEINTFLKNNIADELSKGESFVEFLEDFKGEEYLVTFLSVNNINNEHKGYLVVYEKDNYFALNKIKFSKQMYILVFIFLTASLFHVFLRISRRKFLYFATRDFLTGVYNRNKFNEFLEKEHSRVLLYDEKLSLIITDIDFFKKVNDNFGHVVGDEVLKRFCSLLEKNIRKSDVLARWGGEEFIILLSNTNLQEAEKVAEKLRKLVNDAEFIKDYKISASFGVAELKQEERTDDLIKRADIALYNAKNKGRNRVEVDN